jgi:hypothetical protein
LDLTNSNDIANFPSSLLFKCGNIDLLSFSKNEILRKFDFKLLRPHWKLSLFMEIYKIGAWNGENISVYIDDNLIISQKFEINSKKICSDSFSDEIFNFSGQVKRKKNLK